VLRSIIAVNASRGFEAEIQDRLTVGESTDVQVIRGHIHGVDPERAVMRIGVRRDVERTVAGRDDRRVVDDVVALHCHEGAVVGTPDGARSEGLGGERGGPGTGGERSRGAEVRGALNSTGARPSSRLSLETSCEQAGHIVGTFASFGAWLMRSFRATEALETSVMTYHTVWPPAVPRCSGSVAYSNVKSTRSALLIATRLASSVTPTGALWSKPGVVGVCAGGGRGAAEAQAQRDPGGAQEP
jgi:hypothetical protein